ncbi:MAG: hypothetical protein IKN55_07460 [Oscillospiraceae bacterium]|nr:hypothetical protein [Oscillospiraceae bacterium]
MRIELNYGGLGSIMSVSTMQEHLERLLGRSESVVSSLKTVRSYVYNMNGGVGVLQDALGDIEQRLTREDAVNGNLKQTQQQVSSFLETARKTDLAVAGTVNQNEQAFYSVNEWARPAPATSGSEKSFGEKAWDWLCGVGKAISDTVGKVVDSIKSAVHAIGEFLSGIAKGIHDFFFPKRSVYDSKNGCYGGDQMVFESASASEREKYREIFEKNNPDLHYTDKEFKNYMKKLTSEGCGYVALVNTIFVQYEGREEEFEKVFGFPMYKSNGKLNYEMVIVDLYSRMDNRDELGNLDVNYDYDPDEDGAEGSYDYRSDASGTGTLEPQWEYYLEQYMQEHGVNTTVETDVTVTADNYNSITSSGKQVIVALRDGNLYNMDGSVAQVIDGGHAMTVTGVTDDGMLIVSSWGGQYYIDPAENGTSQEVGSGSDKHTITQSMTFTTVDYSGT